MSKIDDKIQEALREDLPAQVGDVLRERLKEADKLEEQKEQLEQEVESLKDKNRKLQKRINDERDLDKERNELEVKAEELEDKRREQEVFEAKLKAEEAEKRAGLAEKFVDKVFRSPVYRKHINKPVPVDYGQGGGESVEYHSQDETTEVD